MRIRLPLSSVFFRHSSLILSSVTGEGLWPPSITSNNGCIASSWHSVSYPGCLRGSTACIAFVACGIMPVGNLISKLKIELPFHFISHIYPLDMLHTQYDWYPGERVSWRADHVVSSISLSAVWDTGTGDGESGFTDPVLMFWLNQPSKTSQQQLKYLQRNHNGKVIILQLLVWPHDNVKHCKQHQQSNDMTRSWPYFLERLICLSKYRFTSILRSDDAHLKCILWFGY